MPGTVLTVASGKGGVGKTTTAVNLSVALWQDGNTVALVDADLGMANLAAVLSLEPGPTLHDVLAGEATAEEAVIEAKNGDLLVLPGSSELAGFADADPGRLQLVVSNLADRCDYVIVDTGAGLSYEDVLPLGMADAVLLVTTPDPAAIGDTRKTLQLAGLVDAPVLGVVVTRAIEETDAPSIARQLDSDLLGRIPEDAAVTESAIRGDPLESHAPDAPATVAYRELADTIEDAVRGEDFEAPSAEPADVDAQLGDTTDGPSSESDESEPLASGGGGDDATDDQRTAEDGEPDDAEDVDERAEDDPDDPSTEAEDVSEEADEEAPPPDEPERRGGFFGWLGRLFS